jgi:hypothetical protein
MFCVTYRPLEIYQSALFVVVVVVVGGGDGGGGGGGGFCFVAVVDYHYDIYDGGGGGSSNLVAQPLMRSGLLNRCLRIYEIVTLHSRVPSCW